MIIITPDAAEQLRTLEVDGNAAKLEFNAEEDGEGGYNCTVALVGAATPGADLEEIDGITVSFRGMASSVFAGAIVGLTPEGELMLEMAEGGCDCGGGCDDGSCGCGGH